MNPEQKKEIRAKLLRYFDRQLPEGQMMFNPAEVARAIRCSTPHVHHLIEMAQKGEPGLVATNIALPGAKRDMWRVQRLTLVRYLATNSNVTPEDD